MNKKHYLPSPRASAKTPRSSAVKSVAERIETAKAASARLGAMANADVARQSQTYFKTGKGQYGEGDRFRGIRVPMLRTVARECSSMPLGEMRKLLRSPFHEDRLLGVVLMANAYQRGDAELRDRTANAYLADARYVNNWDLVDSSAAQILGPHFQSKPDALRKLARSSNIWERRMAIIATFHYIKNADCALTMELCEQLLADKHDLIHKACGWMLREAGRRCGAPALRMFLDEHAGRMPRTMLRYAIEHFSPSERAHYMDARGATRA